jgi:molybdopterin synthase sulfur carrier subunit
MVRVELPAHLRTLAGVSREVTVDLPGPVTPRSIMDALETQYPALSGTMRDHVTGKRRPFVRFFACGQDLSLKPADTPLPDEIAAGREPFLIIGAIAGG